MRTLALRKYNGHVTTNLRVSIPNHGILLAKRYLDSTWVQGAARDVMSSVSSTVA